MVNFMVLIGLDGRQRAAPWEAVRLLEDRVDPKSDDGKWEGVTVTLVDGTQYHVIGTVESILAVQCISHCKE